MTQLAKIGFISVVVAVVIAHFYFVNFYAKLVLFAIPIVIAALWSLAHPSHFRRFTAIQYVVAGYLLAGFISVFHSSNTIYSLSYYFIYLSLILIAFHAVRMCRSEQECMRLLWSIGRVILVVVLVSGIFIISPASWNLAMGVQRFKGIYLHPVSYGNLLALFLIIWIGYTFYRKGPSRLLHYLICLAVLIQIVLTKSRTPIFALIGVALYLLASTYYLRDRSRDAVLLRSAFMSISIPLVPIIILQWGGDVVRFMIRGQGDTFFQLTGRIFMWQVAWQQLTHNWLFGEGFAMAGRILVESRVYLNPEIVDNPVLGIGGVTHLHNAWLQAALQTNILGTIFFSILIIMLGKKVYLALRGKAVSSSPFLTYVCSGILFFTFIIMFVTSTPADGRDITLFLFFFTLFAADKYILRVPKRNSRAFSQHLVGSISR